MDRTAIRNQLRGLYDDWLARPFPERGKDIDGYPEYNADLAGCVSRQLGRQEVRKEEIPDLPALGKQQLAGALTDDDEEAEDLRQNEEAVEAIRALLERLAE